MSSPPRTWPRRTSDRLRGHITTTTRGSPVKGLLSFMNERARQTSRSGHGHAYLDAILGLVVLAAALLRGVVRLLAKLLTPIGTWGRQRKVVDTGPAVEASPPPGFQPQVSSMSRDYSTYEPAAIRVAQLQKVGYLTLWGYKDKGVVHRQLVVSDQTLTKALGVQRLPLPDKAWGPKETLDMLLDQSIVECDIFVAQHMPVQKAGSKVLPAVSQAEVVKAVAAPQVAEVAAIPEPAPETTQDPDLRTSKPYIGHASVVSQRTVGRLQYAGAVSSTFGGAGKRGQTFGVDLQTDERPVRLHGVDLERALAVAGARLGDIVEIELTGTTEVPLPNGGKGNKKHYIARVLSK